MRTHRYHPPLTRRAPMRLQEHCGVILLVEGIPSVVIDTRKKKNTATVFLGEMIIHAIKMIPSLFSLPCFHHSHHSPLVYLTGNKCFRRFFFFGAAILLPFLCGFLFAQFRQYEQLKAAKRKWGHARE